MADTGTWQDAVDIVTPHVVRIRTPRGSGTGFFSHKTKSGLMWGSDYPHSESTFSQSRKILAEILAGVPEEEQAKIVGGNTARVYRFDVARLTPR
jgi:hypothetical protein